jgi:hypothetical protein
MAGAHNTMTSSIQLVAWGLACSVYRYVGGVGTFFSNIEKMSLKGRKNNQWGQTPTRLKPGRFSPLCLFHLPLSGVLETLLPGAVVSTAATAALRGAAAAATSIISATVQPDVDPATCGGRGRDGASAWLMRIQSEQVGVLRLLRRQQRQQPRPRAVR